MTDHPTPPCRLRGRLRPVTIVGIVLALALAVAGIVLTASASSAEDRAQDDINRTVAAYHRHLTDGNGQATCAMLTRRAQLELADRLSLLFPRSCVEAVNSIGPGITDESRQAVRSIRVRRARITADRAVVQARDITISDERYRSDTDRTAILLRQQGRWIIDRLG